MSGWAKADQYIEENSYSDIPAVNNHTIYGYLPSDQIPSPSMNAFILTYSDS